MKKLLCFIFLLLSSQLLFAEPPKQIIFFGDSLSDNGNLSKALLNRIPKAPPYYPGHFTNGLCWSDHLADYFLSKFNATSANYAVAGATAVFRSPTRGFVPISLNMEVNDFLLRNLGTDKSQLFFVIWMGANDYSVGDPNIEKATDAVIKAIHEDLIKLIRKGGKNFLLLNLPDLSKTPYGKISGHTDNLQQLTLLHNNKLANLTTGLQQSYPDVKFKLIDVYSLFDDLIANPEKYNRKYHLDIQNTSDACWTGGYTLRHDKDALNAELHKAMPDQSKQDIERLTQTILQSPSLAEAYATGKRYEEGQIPCSNPGQLLFWDYVHPTASVHLLIYKMVVENLLNERVFA